MLFNLLLCFIFMDTAENAVYRDTSKVDYSKEQENEVSLSQNLACPSDSNRLLLFAYKCETDADCKEFGEICCQEKKRKICRPGVEKKSRELDHKPLLPGIPRICPSKEAVIEILPVQNCTTDADCTPRICCPDGSNSYCRTAVPKISSDFYPRIMKSFKTMMAYLQCTSPPPPLLDFFPKPCKNSLDCFPNLCCQERGRKICRPPKRSLLMTFTALT